MQQANEIDLKRLVLAVRRQFSLVLGAVTLFVVLATAYLATTKPLFTAETLLFLDKSITNTISENTSGKQMAFDSAAIESEVEVIRSRGMADAVLRSMKRDEQTEEERSRQIDEFLSSLSVKRKGETYVLSIKYTSESPQEAADVANAYANTYITEQLSSLFDISSRTATWMKSKIDTLRQQSLDAQNAVTDYRKRYNDSRQGFGGRNNNGEDAVDKEGLAELNNLQKEADTYKALYESFLAKHETVNMQQSYPVTETRVISVATPPDHKSHPITALILGVAVVLGAGVGVMLALIVDNFDRTLRRGGQVKREIGVPFLGFMPLRKKSRRMLPFVSSAGKTVNLEMMTSSIDDPFSLYSETARTIRHAIDSRYGNGSNGNAKRVIGVVSSDSGEGKAIVAASIALYMAQFSGTILLDADMRSDSKRKRSKSNAGEKGLEDILLGKTAIKETILHCKSHNLSVIPSFQNDLGQTLAFLDTDKVKRLVDECQKQHDYVIIELPPLTSTADVYSFAQAVDCLVVVAEWGKTQPNELNFHLQQNGMGAGNILGVVLENADMERMSKFYGHKVNT
ncbi:MAG TPA: hypothetical protein DEA55_05800 [Rhodospirillaceae bacterium]|nr:hypothetical protein [Rhodospirillaceae bacterium]